MAEVKPIGLDGEGSDLLTKAVKELLNLYPGLGEKEILFEELSKDSGIAFSADNGALILSEKKSITGKIYQKCQYPFYVIYRTSAQMESQKIYAQSLLDTLGRWISGEKITIGEMDYKLTSYPELTDGREIYRITRMNSYGLEPDKDGVQDWLLPCTVEYKHTYYK